MPGRVCRICDKTVCNLPQHLQYVHKMDAPRRRLILKESAECLPLEHPFTMRIAGPTGAGKTRFVKNLLEQRSRTIHPVPERIVWFYSRWQSAYEDMAKHMPQLEFVQGIPYELGNQNYFDSSVANLCVLDDLMSKVKDDNVIAQMFTQGSHHGNLSVIYITQNVFPAGKASRDIALNSSYLVLFNNVTDRLQIALLAKRMYPGHPERFLQRYEEAITGRPHGYLFVNLKTTTPESCRLQDNILETVNTSRCPLPVMEKSKCLGKRSRDSVCTVRDPDTNTRAGENLGSEIKELICTIRANMDKVEERSSFTECLECGGVFGSSYDVRRHETRHCPVRKRDDEEEESDEEAVTPAKKPTLSVDTKTWQRLFYPIMNYQFDEELEPNIARYMQSGYSRQAAKDKSVNDLLPKLRKALRKHYVTFLVNVDRLSHDAIHNKIISTATKLKREACLDWPEAVEQAVKMRKGLFDDVIKEREVIETHSTDDDDDSDTEEQ